MKQTPLILVIATLLATACASRDPKSPPASKQADIHYTHGTHELMAKNYTQAITHLLKAVEFAPENPEIHNNLGMAYYFKNEREMALQHIRRALELDPKNTDARLNLASLQFERGDLKSAEKLYLEALKDLTYEKHARTYFNLALIEQRRGDQAKSLAYFRRSVKEDTDYCPSWLAMGQIEYNARRYADAAKHFRQARMGVCANDPAPLYWQGATDMKLGDFFNARTKFEDLLGKFGDSSYAPMARERMSEISLLELRKDQSAQAPAASGDF